MSPLSWDSCVGFRRLWPEAVSSGMKSDLTRFAPDVRTRAAKFENEFGILSLPPEGLSVDAIETFQAELLADWERMSRMSLSQYLDTVGHDPLEKSYSDQAVARHYRATKEILLRGGQVSTDAAIDHQDRVRQETGRFCAANGNVAWLAS